MMTTTEWNYYTSHLETATDNTSAIEKAFNFYNQLKQLGA